MKNNHHSFNEAQKFIPGGVNSPVRSFKSVNSTPFFTKMAKDHLLIDIENKSYTDYVCSWGANIIGHANKDLVDYLKDALENGCSFGTPTELETLLAKKICSIIPTIEKIRFVNSGTEAVMSAIRLARGYTNKKYIIKFDGCYHGHYDAVLVNAGSGAMTFNNPSSNGVLKESAMHTIVLEYNNVSQLIDIFNKYHNEIAGIICEPIAGNMNLILPTAEFLNTMAKLTTTHKSLLIFDEVMTGFRVALKGAQSIYNIKPDITILGKIIGGGLPLAAFGGKSEIMDYLSPVGNVYQAGTLSGNPIAVSCGLKTLDIITSNHHFYETINHNCNLLINGMNILASKYNITFCANNVGGMFGIHFQKQLPQNLSEAKQASQLQFINFFNFMLMQNQFFAPSMFEAGFISIAHTPDVISTTLDKVEHAFQRLSHTL